MTRDGGKELNPLISKNDCSHQGIFYAVPYTYNFLRHLATFILDQGGANDPCQSLRTLIIMPTRRSQKLLKDNLLNNSILRPSIIPHLTTFNDIASCQLLQVQSGEISTWQSLVTLVKIIHPLLADIHPLKTIIHYAQTLLPLLEEWQLNQLTVEHLEAIFPHQLATHLQNNLDLFYKALNQFPSNHLQAYQQDRALQTLLLERQDIHLIVVTDAPSNKHQSTFLQSCAGRANTHVFLLGYDPTLQSQNDDEEPQPHHPCYGFHKLMMALDQPAQNLPLFPQNMLAMAHRHRQRFIHRVFNDDDLFKSAQDYQGSTLQEALKDISFIACHDQHEEARTIAVILRESLEHPQRKTALVTPDRTLAALVKAHLRQWEIDVDDSAGEPFFNTALGTFLKLTGECLSQRFASLPFLSLLKHPFCRLGRPVASVRRMARRFELLMLRQHSFAQNRLAEWKLNAQEDEMIDILTDIDNACHDACVLFQSSDMSFKTLLLAHIDVTRTLAMYQDDELAQSHDLFAGETGQNIRKLLDDITAASDDLPLINGQEYLGILIELLHSQRIRRTYGYHPRLFIFDHNQVQLYDFDCVVLSGLNTGVWPQSLNTDPWFSQDMRQRCGLPTAMDNLGIELQRFINTLATPQVILTRAQKSQGTVNLPSPWIQRLQTVIKAVSSDNVLKAHQDWSSWQQELHRVHSFHISRRPAPQPLLTHRPRELSSRDLTLLMDDPYAFYAQKILNVRPVAELDHDPNSAVFGQIIHQFMDYAYKEPGHKRDVWLRYGEVLFAPMRQQFPLFHNLHWPRFMAIIDWLLDVQQLEPPTQTFTKVQGILDIAVPYGPLRIKTLIDRVDIIENRYVKIIDYRTGKVFSSRQLAQGQSPEILLNLVIAQHGLLQGIPPLPLQAFELWQLGRSTAGGECVRLEIVDESPLQQAMTSFYKNLQELIYAYDQPIMRFQAPWKLKTINDYHQLSRRFEWSTPLL